MRRISILGSTGSIGRSTLAVVDAFPEELSVVGLAAGGNIELLAQQIERYRPEVVSVRSEEDAKRLRNVAQLMDNASTRINLAMCQREDMSTLFEEARMALSTGEQEKAADPILLRVVDKTTKS